MQSRFRKAESVAKPRGRDVDLSQYEKVSDVDSGYCFDLCCTYYRELKACGKMDHSIVPDGYCGISVPYKIMVIKREQDKAKPWMTRYMSKLLHMQGEKA